MAETLIVPTDASREALYQDLLPQLKGLVSGETNTVANLANVCAALRQTFGFFWVGFYLVDGDTLVLGPFQGDLACTRIAKGKGVCGTAWSTGQAQLVADVDAFPGHIACSSASRSEIVVPIKRADKVIAVLDVDSDVLNDFDEKDLDGLLQICDWLQTIM